MKDMVNIVEKIRKGEGVVIPTPTAQKESTFQLIYCLSGYNRLSETTPRVMGLLKNFGQLRSYSHSHSIGKRMYLTVGNYKNYPQLWVIVVGSSGTGKSDAGRVAFRRISEIDTERYIRYQEEYKEWEAEEKQGRPPRWEQMLINDTTPEAMFNALSHAENGLTLNRDELSGWFSDFGRYNKSGEVGHYLLF